MADLDKQTMLGGLESPFLKGELFLDEATGDMLPTLTRESAFQGAFETSRTQTYENIPLEEVGVINENNWRRIQDTRGVPWRWICKIVVRKNNGDMVSQGTGLLVSARHVLTAAHVVEHVFDAMYQYTITVTPGLNYDKEPFGSLQVTSKPKYPRCYRQDCLTENKTKLNKSQFDYALLTLNKSVDSYWGSDGTAVFERLDPEAIWKSKPVVYTAGYPGSKGGLELWCARGSINPFSPYMRIVGINANVTSGQSGSPVWLVKNGKNYLIGIAVTAPKDSAVVKRGKVEEKTSHGVVRVTKELIRQVRRWIAEDGDTPTMTEGKELPEVTKYIADELDEFTLNEQEDWHGTRAQAFAENEDRGENFFEGSSGEQDWAQTECEESSFGIYSQEEALPYSEPETPRQEFDSPPVIPKDVEAALGRKDWPQALSLAIQAGWRDKNDLTNLIFFARHPELPREPLTPNNPDYKQLGSEWAKILDKEVWKAIQKASVNNDLVVTGKEASDHQRFFWGKAGGRLKQLVADAAQKVDINPGLLGTIMMAETRRPRSYLSGDKVSSYHIGTDDFYEGRSAIAARVPAYAKVKWDKNQTPTVHDNDAQTNPRKVKTILFNSGPDGVLATAVYVKFYEERLREMAIEVKKNFDTLPLPTRFALTRMAMAAGATGARPALVEALNGKDIFVRRNIPVRAYQTRRNATVRTAQAMHLSEWVFGFPIPAATVQPELELEDLETVEGFGLELERGDEELEEQVTLSEEFVDDLSNKATKETEEFDFENGEWESDELFQAEAGEAFADLEGEFFEGNAEMFGEAIQESETAQGLNKKLTFLSLLPHVAEINGTDVPLTPSVMDPGIYDGPQKYKIALTLQQSLQDAMKKSRLGHVRVALVDLTKSLTAPEFAGYYHKDQQFAASTLKIVPMLAAFQLRHDLRHALKRKGSKTLDDLFSQVRDDWAATQLDPKGAGSPFTAGITLRGKLVLVRGVKVGLIEPKAPHLENIFAKASSPVAIEFNSTGESFARLQTIVKDFNKGKRGSREVLSDLGFLERMKLMVGGDVPASNFATFTVVGDLGYLYMVSTLLQSGLYDTNRNGGLWLGARYGGVQWRGALAGGVPQSTTAGSMAAFLTLMMQDKLVSPAASGEMRDLLQKAPHLTAPGTGSWYQQSLRQLSSSGSIKRLLAKVGLAGGADECAVIEREVNANGTTTLLRYVVVALRANDGGEIEKLVKELDKCILANNGLTPVQGGHPS